MIKTWKLVAHNLLACICSVVWLIFHTFIANKRPFSPPSDRPHVLLLWNPYFYKANPVITFILLVIFQNEHLLDWSTVGLLDNPYMIFWNVLLKWEYKIHYKLSELFYFFVIHSQKVKLKKYLHGHINISNCLVWAYEWNSCIIYSIYVIKSGCIKYNTHLCELYFFL